MSNFMPRLRQNFIPPNSGYEAGELVSQGFIVPFQTLLFRGCTFRLPILPQYPPVLSFSLPVFCWILVFRHHLWHLKGLMRWPRHSKGLLLPWFLKSMRGDWRRRSSLQRACCGGGDMSGSLHRCCRQWWWWWRRKGSALECR